MNLRFAWGALAVRRAPGACPALATCLALAGLLACGERAGGGSSVVARDSADVRIVEIPEGSAPPDTFVLGGAPSLSLGAVDGPAESVLYRVSGAFRLSDGRLVVGNAGTLEVRFYLPDGTIDLAVGGEGDGPGEFQNMTWVGPAGGDSVAVFDYGSRRMTIFTPDGLVGRDFRLAEFPAPNNWDLPASRFPRVRGRLSDGRFVVGASPISTTGTAYEGVPEDSVLYYYFQPTGEIAGNPVSTPSDENWVRSSENQITSMTVPFGRSVWSEVGPERLWIAASDTSDVMAYDSAGALRTIIRREAAPRPVTQADVDRDRERMMESAAGYPEWQKRMRELLPHVPVAEHLPRLAGLFVDDLGCPWVHEWDREGDDGPWTVYDPTGRPLASVRLPAGLQVMQISRGEVIGVRVDDLSVEHLEVYPLTAPALAERED